MKLFSSLKQKAIDFLEPYKTKEPATYAAAEQAIGAVLITDGLFGINHPLSQKKRSGIFGTIGGIILGIIFMFVPTFFGNLSGINDMTATTTATVVSVGQASYTRDSNGTRNALCPMTIKYSVNGKEYTSGSSMQSSDYCSFSEGQNITINYNPNNPESWIYGSKEIGFLLQTFFWVGLLVLISSIITFLIRLFSIIFGWKLLKDGRKNAKNLPPETNLQTMIDEIKQNFTASIFGFGNATGYMPEIPPIQGPMNPNI